MLVKLITYTVLTSISKGWRMSREQRRRFVPIPESLIDEAMRVSERVGMPYLVLIEKILEANLRMGEIGSELITDSETVLTHCNAGSLATSGLGTALGIIKTAWRKGKNIRVIATETRPLLQGARLTAWELKKAGIPFKLVTDNMVGYLFYEGLVDRVIVGADRITIDGYVANKIGT